MVDHPMEYILPFPLVTARVNGTYSDDDVECHSHKGMILPGWVSTRLEDYQLQLNEFAAQTFLLSICSQPALRCHLHLEYSESSFLSR